MKYLLPLRIVVPITVFCGMAILFNVLGRPIITPEIMWFGFMAAFMLIREIEHRCH